MGGEPRLVAFEIGFRDESPFLRSQSTKRALGLVRENVIVRAPSFARSGWALGPELALLRLIRSPSAALP